MRPVLLALLVAACSPAVSPQTGAFDEEIGPKQGRTFEGTPLASQADALAPDAPRPVAPTGKGLRSGTITRDKLVAVLDKGPGAFLQQLEVAPRMAGERFVGWQLVQLLGTSPLVDIDLAPGDVLLAVNGKPLSRPDQLQTLWDSLRTANQLSAQLWRGDKQFTLEFSIEPPLTAAAPTAPIAPTAPTAPTSNVPAQLSK